MRVLLRCNIRFQKKRIKTTMGWKKFFGAFIIEQIFNKSKREFEKRGEAKIWRALFGWGDGRV
jgi:hypothetical protein